MNGITKGMPHAYNIYFSDAFPFRGRGMKMLFARINFISRIGLQLVSCFNSHALC